jgi:hypothetical protein
MKDLEKFRERCKMEILAVEKTINEMNESNEPKWTVQKFKGDSNLFDCQTSLKMIEKFESDNNLNDLP